MIYIVLTNKTDKSISYKGKDIEPKGKVCAGTYASLTMGQINELKAMGFETTLHRTNPVIEEPEVAKLKDNPEANKEEKKSENHAPAKKGNNKAKKENKSSKKS